MHRKLALKMNKYSLSFFEDGKMRALRRRYLLIFCLVLSALFALSPRLFGLSYGSVDESFNYAFNQAAADHLHFGSSFISTYGPLGYLISNYLPRNLFEVTVWSLLYAGLLGTGVYLFIDTYCKKIRYPALIAALFLYVFSATNGGDSYEWNLLAVFLLYGFLYLKQSIRARYVTITCLALVSAVFLLVKFTTGFGALLSLVFLPLGTSSNIRSKLKQLALSLGVFAVTFVALGSYLNIDNFVSYIKTGLLLSSGFSAAMGISYGQAATVILAISLGLAVIWLVWDKERKISPTYLFVLPVLGLVWKYGVARQDIHILRTLQIIVPLTLLMYYSRKRAVHRDKLLACLIVALAVLSMWANQMPFNGANSFATVALSPLKNVLHKGPVGFFRFSNQKKLWSQESATGLQSAVLPSSMRQKLGTGGVDIFPWGTSIVAANHLNWQPRPSPFSFESYDPYLDNLNAQYFKSTNAPAFIVWHNTGVNSIDYRYLLWDEPATLRSILQNYEVVDRSSDFTLLKRESHPKAAVTQNLETVTSHWGDWVSLPKTRPGSELFAKIKVKRDIYSKLSTQLVRSDTFLIEFENGGNQTLHYQFVLENGSQGLLVDNLPQDWDDLQVLLGNKYFSGDTATAFRLAQTSSHAPTHAPVIVQFFTEDFNQ